MLTQSSSPEEHLEYVRSIALRKYGHGCPDIDDLVGCGIIGAIRASRSYDPSSNLDYKNWIFKRSYGAMRDYWRSCDRINYVPDRDTSIFPNVIEQIYRNELRSKVIVASRKLPKQYRLAVILTLYDVENKDCMRILGYSARNGRVAQILSESVQRISKRIRNSQFWTSRMI